MASPTQWTSVWASSGSWWWMEAWSAAVHGVAKSQTWLSDWTDWNLVIGLMMGRGGEGESWGGHALFCWGEGSVSPPSESGGLAPYREEWATSAGSEISGKYRNLAFAAGSTRMPPSYELLSGSFPTSTLSLVQQIYTGGDFTLEPSCSCSQVLGPILSIPVSHHRWWQPLHMRSKRPPGFYP